MHYTRWFRHGDPLGAAPAPWGVTRKWTLNEAYFERVDTPEKAYWLGFIAADGCVLATANRLTVELSGKDASHLAQLNADLNYDRPLSWNRSCAATVAESARLVADLASHGILPRKTTGLMPWDGPPDLMPHYWRGMVDGDGSIYHVRSDWVINLTGTKAVVRSFGQWAGVACGSTAQPRQAAGAWTLSICGAGVAYRLAVALYAEPVRALPRKLALAREILSVRPDELRKAANARR